MSSGRDVLEFALDVLYRDFDTGRDELLVFIYEEAPRYLITDNRTLEILCDKLTNLLLV